MNDFSLEDIRSLDFRGTKVDFRYGVLLFGEFSEAERGRSGFACFSIQFSDLKSEFDLADIEDDQLESFEASEDGDRFVFELILSSDPLKKITFKANVQFFNLYRYNGFSYANVYDKRFENIDGEMSVISNPELLKREDRKQLSDDLELVRKTYTKNNHSVALYSVLKNSEEIFRHINVDDQVDLKNPYIEHSNGHRYVAIKLDLYGISYLEPDTGEVYHYIPEGFRHDYRETLGESFIITAVKYNKDNNMVAYEGCYWAGPCDVLVGNLEDPLNYDPHLLRINAHYMDDIDDEAVEASWGNNKLIIKGDDNVVEIPMAELMELMQKGN